jgi:putative N6-adenine-specific DNA methylase
MLLGVGYDGSAPLVDPFAGSGTIPIEAALLARRIAPGLQRAFAFARWPSFDRSAWTAVRDEAAGRIRAPAPAPIHGSDRDAGAVLAARGNAERAGVAGDVSFREAALSDLSPPDGPGFVVSNPPYGVRLGETKDLRDLFARLGAVARRRCPGWNLALLSADEALERQLGIPLTAGWRSSNGGIPVRLVTGTIPA